MSKSRVRILTTSDTKRAARTLLKAFRGDRVNDYLSHHLRDQPEMKERVDIALYEAYVYSHVLKGLVVGVDGDSEECFETVLLWAVPFVDVEDTVTMARSGYLRFSWLTGAEGRQRVFNELFPLLHNTQHEIVGDVPTYTLVYVGSTPEAQGKGNLRAMFEFMFEEYIDRDQALAYLESSAMTNIPIYERFGFKQVRDIYLGQKGEEDSARMDVMVRQPKGKVYDIKQ